MGEGLSGELFRLPEARRGTAPGAAWRRGSMRDQNEGAMPPVRDRVHEDEEVVAEALGEHFVALLEGASSRRSV